MANNETIHKAGRRGEIASFAVHIQYTERGTWQGNVVWNDTRQKQSFRSALELIKMMDAAVEQSRSTAAVETKGENQQ